MKQLSRDSLYENLQAARKAFKEFVATAGLDGANPNMGLSERARLITDANLRRQYCDLAIVMLKANTAYYRPDATPLPEPKRSSAALIVPTLIVAAIALQMFGPVVALLAAAACYWLAERDAVSRHEVAVRNAEEHDKEVKEWQETLAGWERECSELENAREQMHRDNTQPLSAVGRELIASVARAMGLEAKDR
ncbi:hypothetical protein [Cupriavidus basilensis]|uniref:hypothetical protein n=1 Tax=Cupriavidus basilensis TaxID=68895 RepID=UPI0005BC8BAD|nr:hypothetical protein [Cupriavidus basilensis]